MRRVSVDEAIYDDPESLPIWLSEQNLSRFYVELSRADGKVELDVHELPEEPVTETISRVHDDTVKTCSNRDCPVCSTNPNGPHIVIEDEDAPESPDEYRQPYSFSAYLDRPVPDLPAADVTGYLPVLDDSFKPEQWYKQGTPLRLGEETDPIRRYPRKAPVSPATLAVWVASISLALLAAFICVRLWYVKYGCPFWPDQGLLSACKALTIHVGK